MAGEERPGSPVTGRARPYVAARRRTLRRSPKVTSRRSPALAAQKAWIVISPAVWASAPTLRFGAKVFGVDPALVKRFAVDTLSVVKISYPRKTPQGGAVERDMHSGQQYVRLLDTPLT
jgi:Domain of unknown function (DUF4387)